MGSALKPSARRVRTVGTSQQRLHAPLADALISQIQHGPTIPGFGGVFEDVIRQSMSGEPVRGFTPEATERVFQEQLLAPALRSFDEELAPRIDAGFAQTGGLLSSRRGDARARTLEGIHTEATGQLAGLLQQQQQLRAQLSDSARVRALQTALGLHGAFMEPFGQATRFATAQTRQPLQGSSPLGAVTGIGTAVGGLLPFGGGGDG